MSTDLTVCIDATRIRSGGGRAHIRGIVSGADPVEHGIRTVHLLANNEVLSETEDPKWLEKHLVSSTQRMLLTQLRWQALHLPRIAKSLGCDLLFNADAGSLCGFRPCATLSQDMLPFEPGEMERYGWGRARLRLEFLNRITRLRLSKSDLQVYLTNYAREIIGRNGVHLGESVVIGHGVEQAFFDIRGKRRPWPANGDVRCLYISNVTAYKHQWNVVEAISELRTSHGIDLKLKMVGGGSGPWMDKLEAAIRRFDPDQTFTTVLDFIPSNEIPSQIAEADVFIYASSCENQPITLLEGMAAGIPICSSGRGPMPEVLEDCAPYFDPESPTSIVSAMLELLGDENLRKTRVANACKRADQYTWAACARETWKALAGVAKNQRV